MPLDLPGYHLARRLGRGESDIWLAWSDRSGVAPLVLKWPAPDPDDGGRAWEAAVLGAVDHPNLIRLLGVEDGPVLVLPFLAGGSLRDLLDERGTLTAGEVVAILGPVAAALDALHGFGLAHGDLKPDNVLLDATGTPVLADLGCARPLAGVRAPAGLRAVPDRLQAATPAYLDPGQLAGGPARVEADVFALGVTAYELLTGRCPHRGEPAELLAAAAAGLHRALGSWPGIAPAVGRAVEAAIDADADRRPRSASALVALLAAAIEPGDIVLPGPASGAPPPVRPVDRHRDTQRFGPAPPTGAAPRRDGLGSLARWPTKRRSQSRRCP